MNYPLLDKHGNMGSIYAGDDFAAMRYTYTRLSPYGQALVDLKRIETTPSADVNYDEPKLMSLKFPNILCNPTLGIGIGFSTCLMAHRLEETVDTIIKYMNDPAIDEDILIDTITEGLSFPTLGENEVLNQADLRDVYKKGGKIVVKGKTEIMGDTITITGLPYQVSLDSFLGKIGKLIMNGEMEEIKDVIDASDKKSIKIKVICKKGKASVVESKLVNLTPLRKTFSGNFNVIIENKVKQLSLKGILSEYTKAYNHQVVYEKTNQRKALEKELHLNDGLIKCLLDVDKTIQIVRGSADKEEAAANLKTAFQIDDEQAKKVLGISLSRLTKMDTNEIIQKSNSLRLTLSGINDIINKEEVRKDFIVSELEGMVDRMSKYSPQRFTEIGNSPEFLSTTSETKVAPVPETYVIGETIETLSEEKDGVGIKTSVNNLKVVYDCKGQNYSIAFYEDGSMIRTDDPGTLPTSGLVNVLDSGYEYYGFLSEQGKAKLTLGAELCPTTRVVKNKPLKGTGLRAKDKLKSVIGTNDKRVVALGESNAILINDLPVQGKTSQGVKIKNDSLIASFDKEVIIVVNEEGKAKNLNHKFLVEGSRSSQGVKISGAPVQYATSANKDEKIFVMTDKGNVSTRLANSFTTPRTKEASGNNILSSKTHNLVGLS